jgi:hypothetical protein
MINLIIFKIILFKIIKVKSLKNKVWINFNKMIRFLKNKSKIKNFFLNYLKFNCKIYKKMVKNSKKNNIKNKLLKINQ